MERLRRELGTPAVGGECLTACVTRPSHLNVIQNQNIVIENLSFENVEKFKYLEVTLINANEWNMPLGEFMKIE